MPGDQSRRAVPAVSSSAWLEAGITIILGLALYVLGSEELAQVSWIVGGLLVLNRAMARRDLDAELSVREDEVCAAIARYNGMAEILDISRGTTQHDLRDLNDLYFKVVESEFNRVRLGIVGEARSRLALMAQQKRSPSLLTGEYYNWLLPMIAAAEPGSEIWAISMLLDCEFDDSAEEQEWLRLHVDAIRRGVKVHRTFVVPQTVAPEDVAAIDAVLAQVSEAGPENIRLAEQERLRRVDPQLLGRLGDGIIAFDRRVVLVDEHSETGAARGYVSMDPTEIARWRNDFENITRLSRPMPVTQKSIVEGAADSSVRVRRSRHV